MKHKIGQKIIGIDPSGEENSVIAMRIIDPETSPVVWVTLYDGSQIELPKDGSSLHLDVTTEGFKEIS